MTLGEVISVNAIEFKEFSCYYKHKKQYITALSEINLTVEEGEFLVVVGESGSGKSTLLKACLGIAEFYDGDLLIDSTPIEEIDFKVGKFAFVRQEIVLYPNLTVYENIAFPLRMMKASHEETDRRVREIAELIGLQMFLTRKPRQLSGGQQQRVAIGRALIKNPGYLFFDEPFSNVDRQLRAELHQLVKGIHEKFRPTVIFVTHDIPEALTLAERIVVLEQGKIVEAGTPAELCAQPKSELMQAFVDSTRDGGQL